MKQQSDKKSGEKPEEKTKQVPNKKATYRQLLDFPVMARPYFNNKTAKTQFEHAVHVLMPRIPKVKNRYQELRQEIYRSCSPVDDGGYYVIDEKGNQMWNAEAVRIREQKVNNLLDSPCGIEPYFAKSLPKDGLTLVEVLIFEGLVISTAQADSIRNLSDDDLPQ